ncbi:MAG: ATP-dependent sacrificial sulfur transferase LarE [Promethearchaeota archaeon]
MDLSKNLRGKLENLTSFLSNRKVIVAFSGGVDSSLLAFLSNKFAKKALLVTEKSILYPDEEIRLTSEFAKKHSITHLIIERNPLNDEKFRVNPKNRCYICKTGLYEDIIKIKEERNFDIILDGSNIDDLSDYRPGMQALKELNITTPYIDFKINKQEIREICKYFNLEVQSKPSMACFSSRIPYDQDINEEKLDMIRGAEKFLRDRFNLKQLRVRLHEETLARIEFLPDDFAKIFTLENIELIKRKFKTLGFTYITVDIEGFRSGSMNEVLDLAEQDESDSSRL